MIDESFSSALWQGKGLINILFSWMIRFSILCLAVCCDEEAFGVGLLFNVDVVAGLRKVSALQ